MMPPGVIVTMFAQPVINAVMQVLTQPGVAAGVFLLAVVVLSRRRP
jgi:hypothetical protein